MDLTRLSVLDLSPVSGEETQAQAVRDSLEVAAAADRLGYHRIWFAEHHSMATISSATPEILIAAATQRTTRIRLGSGGVMLPNYSPLKVAETFMALEALAPGRIDLGVGRALGADARTGAALRSQSSEVFPHYFALLNAWLLDAAGKEPFPERHPASGVKASPSGPSHPALFMLTSSIESAIFAGRAGVGMVFSEFIARTDGAPAVAAYRQAFEPSPFLAEPFAGIGLIAFAAETAEAAQRLDMPRRASTLAFQTGERRRFATAEAAEAYLAENEGHPLLAQIAARSLTGDGPTVRAALADKARAAHVDELFVMSVGPTLQDRIRSLELMAEG
ncbi:MAG TPA: MsnO8 family LLM class oxidoreductase [Caulobacteraceae bacterium]|nr:MsnO8 family LLM class oxidoreductase [Caulobacteraceae bacterium]